jgi:hypothetical protein
MKYKSDEVAGKLFPIVKAGNPYIFKHPKVDFSDVKNKALEQALYNVRDLLGATMRASLQINGVYEDTIVCHKMIGSFPWKMHRISRAQHLRFVWAQFTSLCYLFEERFKLFVSLQHRTMATFKKKKTDSIAEGVKSIRKELGQHIRQRGQNTHEWSTSNPHAEHFETIEFINSVKLQVDGPLGNVAGQYRITRLLMRWEIEATIKFMEEFLLDLFEKQIPELAGCALMFNELGSGPIKYLADQMIG